MRILHPTDFSEPAERARREAIRLARVLGGEVVLLHVLTEAPLYAEGLGGVQIDRVHAAQEASGRSRLEASVAETRAAGVPARGRLEAGVPAQEVVRAARDERADLIVMGTHGRGGVGRLLLGSVADRVVRTAACPVVTVRGGQESGALAAAGREGTNLPTEELRERLLEQRVALLREVARVEDELRALQGGVESAERGQEAVLASLLARLGDRGREQVDAIDRALGRLASGTYGRCQDCGSQIPLSRLRARPTTALCLRCAEAREP